MGKLAVYEKQTLASPDQQISLTDPDSRLWRRASVVPASSATMCRSPWARESHVLARRLSTSGRCLNRTRLLCSSEQREALLDQLKRYAETAKCRIHSL
jgi:hypothetical protein